MTSKAQNGSWLLKAVILAVLVGVLMLLRRQFGLEEDVRGSTLLLLAATLLIAHTTGAVLSILKLPRITSYLMVGLLVAQFSESLVPPTLAPLLLPEGVLGASQLRELEPVKMLALSLIALIAGGTLKLDILRSEARPVLGIVALQTLLVFVAITSLVFALSGGIPAIALPELLRLGPNERWALAALASAATLVTSPVATLAVIHEGRADGPMTRTVLTTVIIKDALAMLVFAFLLSSLGGSLSDGLVPRSGLQIVLHVIASLVLGSLLGTAIGLYLRYVNTEVPLVVLAATYLTTFVAEKSQLDPFVLFLAAGAVATNFSDRTSQLIRSVRNYSLPLFLVVFVIEGAHLELTRFREFALLVPLFCILRLGALWAGLRGALRLAGSDPNTERFGWTGFVAQATYVAPLVALLSAGFGEAGTTLGAVLLMSVAVNELVGPLLFRVGLELAGELAESSREIVSSLPKSELPGGAPPRLDVEHPFGPPFESSSPAVNSIVSDLEAELSAIDRDLAHAVFEPLSAQAENHLLELRREFLRCHRRCLVEARSTADLLALKSTLRRELAELADRWRGLVLDRANRVARPGWRPTSLVDAVDHVVDRLPKRVLAPYEPESYRAQQGDSLARRGWRLSIRSRRSARSALGYEVPTRSIALQDVAKYHLSGLLPARLEGLAASLIGIESLLAERTQALFGVVRTGTELIAEGAEGPADTTKDASARLATLRREFELELELSMEDCRKLLEESKQRARRLVGEAVSNLKLDLRTSATPDLPTQARRFGKVFKERTRGLHRLTTVYDELRESEAAQYALLALDLELLALEETAKGPVEEQADQLARLIRGRGRKQLERLVEAIEGASKKVSEVLEQERLGEELADELRGVAEGLNRVAEDVLETTRTLRGDFAEERAATPVLDRLLVAAQSLTEHYIIPTARPGHGEWRLPSPVPTVEVNFRKAVAGFIQSSVSKRLTQVVRDLSERLEPLATTVEELERVLTFNFEVASSELDLFEEGPVTEALRFSTRDGIQAELSRVKERLSGLISDCESWPAEAKDALIHAVVDCLGELRDRAAEGRLPTFRLGLLGEAGVGRRLVREAEGLRGWISQGRRQIWRGLKSALGEDRLDAIRTWLGVSTPDARGRVGRETFLFRPATTELPASYRRLFSGQVLEAGDVLTGRDTELQRARGVLIRSPSPRALRSVCVVGPEPVGNGAVAGSIARGLGFSKVRRLDLDEPVTVEEVRRWFAEGASNQLTILTGFRWLFSMKRGGFEPLRELTRGIVRDAGKEAWLVSAETPVWRFACLAAPIAEAFAEMITLKPLTRDQLEAAILARHQMSGYSLEIETDATWIVKRLFRGEMRRAEASRDLWFRSLHAATGGQLQDALVLWLASIKRVNEEARTVELGPVPKRPLPAMRRLPDKVLLTLRQAALQGWIDTETYAVTFRVSALQAEAHLTSLCQLGLLSPDGGRFEIAAHLAAPLQRVLQERKWLT